MGIGCGALMGQGCKAGMWGRDVGLEFLLGWGLGILGFYRVGMLGTKMWIRDVGL